MSGRQFRDEPSDQTRHPFSDPCGRKTPSEFRYLINESPNGLIIVDFMLIRLNLGYQEENWKERIESGVGVGIGRATGAGTVVDIPAWENIISFCLIPAGCMPLNSHSYLVAQGWKGTGKALREGAINRPVIIAQKKTLAGVGRDRDEAFPFWDQ